MLSSSLNLTIDLSSFSRDLDSQHQAELRTHGLLLGEWLRDLPKLSEFRGEIAEAVALLRSGSAKHLAEALGKLRSQIKAALPLSVGTLVFSASRESSPQLFAESVMGIARAYESGGDFATPVGLYALALQALPKGKKFSDLRTRLQNQINTLQGGDSFTDQLRLGLQRLPHELMSPTVVAMGVGSLVNPLGTLLRGRLGATSTVVAARAGGMVLDATAFTATSQGIATLQGQQTNSFGHDLLHAGLMLTSLRVTGSLARTALSAQGAQAVLKNFGKLAKRTTEITLPLFAEYHGIKQANQLGAWLHLNQVGAHSGLETLFTMAHFRMANSWLKLSPQYGSLHRQLTMETEATLHRVANQTYQGLQSMTSRLNGPGNLGQRRLAYEGLAEPALHQEIRETELLHAPALMEGQNLRTQNDAKATPAQETLDSQILEDLRARINTAVTTARLPYKQTPPDSLPISEWTSWRVVELALAQEALRVTAEAERYRYGTDQHQRALRVRELLPQAVCDYLNRASFDLPPLVRQQLRAHDFVAYQRYENWTLYRIHEFYREMAEVRQPPKGDEMPAFPRLFSPLPQSGLEYIVDTVGIAKLEYFSEDSKRALWATLMMRGTGVLSEGPRRQAEYSLQKKVSDAFGFAQLEPLFQGAYVDYLAQKIVEEFGWACMDLDHMSTTIPPEFLRTALTPEMHDYFFSQLRSHFIEQNPGLDPR